MKNWWTDELSKSSVKSFQDLKENPNERGSEFIHENVDLLYYVIYKTSLKKGISYINCDEWLNNKRAAI